MKGVFFSADSSPVRVRLNSTGLRDVVEQLRRTPAGLDKVLGRTLPYGTAYHHAGEIYLTTIGYYNNRVCTTLTISVGFSWLCSFIVAG